MLHESASPSPPHLHPPPPRQRELLKYKSDSISLFKTFTCSSLLSGENPTLITRIVKPSGFHRKLQLPLSPLPALPPVSGLFLRGRGRGGGVGNIAGKLKACTSFKALRHQAALCSNYGYGLPHLPPWLNPNEQEPCVFVSLQSQAQKYVLSNLWLT